MADRFLTLDIGPDSLTGVVFEASLKKTVPLDAARVPFEAVGPGSAATESDMTEQTQPDPGAPDDGESRFESALDRLETELDLSGCTRAVLLMPTPWFSARTSQLPFKSEAKIAQILPLELQPGLPLEAEPWITDFKRREKGGTVFSLSCPARVIRRHFQALKDRGIQPAMILPRGFAAPAALLKQRKEIRDFIFLDLADGEISLAGFVDRCPMAVRTFDTTRNPCPDLEMELKRMILGLIQKTGQAPAFHLFAGMPRTLASPPAETEKVAPAAPPDLDGLLDHILAFQTGLGRTGQAGKPSAEPGTDPSGVLSYEVLNRGVLIQSLVPGRDHAHAFNFCKGEFGSESFFKAHRAQLLFTAGLALFAFALLMMGAASQVNLLEKQLAGKKQAAARIFTRTFPEKKLGAMDPYLYMQSLIKAAKKDRGSTGSRETLPEQKALNAVAVLHTLSKQIPASLDLTMTRLMLDSDRLILSGSTNNFNSVDQIKGFLEQAPTFKKVEISSAAAGKKSQGVEFKFIIEMEP